MEIEVRVRNHAVGLRFVSAAAVHDVEREVRLGAVDVGVRLEGGEVRYAEDDIGGLPEVQWRS